jgi:hypothetical protein
MKRTTQAIAAVCAALALASCGGDDGEPISQKRAGRLDSLLQQVQRQSDAGSCTTLLEATIPALEKQADALPESVGGDTKETITDGVAHLRDLAETDCAEKQQEELPTTDESTTTTEPSTTTTTREESTTTTEPSTSTDTTPSTSTNTTPPPDTSPPDNPDTGNGGTPPPGVGGVGGGTPKGNGNGNGGGKP